MGDEFVCVSYVIKIWRLEKKKGTGKGLWSREQKREAKSTEARACYEKKGETDMIILTEKLPTRTTQGGIKSFFFFFTQFLFLKNLLPHLFFKRAG